MVAAEYLVALMASNCNTFSLLLYGYLVLVLVFFACSLITSLRTNEGIKDDTAEFSTNMFHTFQRSSNYTTVRKNKQNVG